MDIRVRPGRTVISGLRMYKVISEREVDVAVAVRTGRVARLAGLTSHEVRAIEECAEEFEEAVAP